MTVVPSMYVSSLLSVALTSANFCHCHCATSGVYRCFICPSSAAAPEVFFASRINASRPPAA